MRIQTLWKHFTKSARQHLKGRTPERSLCPYSEKTICLIIQHQNQKKNGASSGSQKQIFDHPGQIIGKTIHFMAPAPCHRCEQFDTYDTCEGINNPSACPQILYKLNVTSIAYQWDRSGLTYIINKGDAELKPEKLGSITIKPWTS